VDARRYRRRGRLAVFLTGAHVVGYFDGESENLFVEIIAGGRVGDSQANVL
jgi:hypothetical protein